MFFFFEFHFQINSALALNFNYVNLRITAHRLKPIWNYLSLMYISDFSTYLQTVTYSNRSSCSLLFPFSFSSTAISPSCCLLGINLICCSFRTRNVKQSVYRIAFNELWCFAKWIAWLHKTKASRKNYWWPYIYICSVDAH